MDSEIIFDIYGVGFFMFLGLKLFICLWFTRMVSFFRILIEMTFFQYLYSFFLQLWAFQIGFASQNICSSIWDAYAMKANLFRADIQGSVSRQNSSSNSKWSSCFYDMVEWTLTFIPLSTDCFDKLNIGGAVCLLDKILLRKIILDFTMSWYKKLH